MTLIPSARAAAGRSSIIREILRLTQDGSVLSLAGGIPAPQAIPLDELRAAAQRLGPEAFSYTPTEGYPPLHARLRELAQADWDEPVTADRLLVTSGSQQALDLLGRVLLDPGDLVAMEHPGYLGAIQALDAYGPEFLPLPVDHDGLDVDALRQALESGARPKLLYTVPEFSNPSGTVLSAQRRHALAELAQRYGFLIVEDDPYGHLRYHGEPPPPLSRMAGAQVLRLGTLSKSVAPGLRVGWAAGPPELIAWMTRAKQAADLQASTTGQALAAELLAQPGWLDQQIARIVPYYAERAEALLKALRRHAADVLEVQEAQGGMFFWARLTRPDADSTALLPTAVALGVAYVPGTAFAVPGGPSLRQGVRLSFATLSPDELDQAAQRLARCFAAAP